MPDELPTDFCRYDTRWRRSLFLHWLVSRLYALGFVRGISFRGSAGRAGRWHVCGRLFRWTLPGRGPYAFGWESAKWGCLWRRHHWPYWPEGRPVFAGLCGRCMRCSWCGSIEQECKPGCPNVEVPHA